MTAFVLPTNLIEASDADSTSELRRWVGQLPAIVGELAQRWSLRLGEPFQPGGSGSWVAPVRDGAGRELVLKVGWRHDEAAHEADGLRAWAGRGAVGLHDAHASGSTSALLLERCWPGTSLGHTVAELEQDLVVAGLLLRLWSAPADAYPFRPLQAMCDAWAAEFQQRCESQKRCAAAPDLLDPGLVRAGIELWRSLPRNSEQEVLLCTDLHAGNVLMAEGEPWLVIDPKPYVGDPAYDPLQHLLNCEERLAADPSGLATRMADLLGLEAERVLLWLFARCVQESIDQPSLRSIATALAPA